MDKTKKHFLLSLNRTVVLFFRPMSRKEALAKQRTTVNRRATLYCFCLFVVGFFFHLHELSFSHVVCHFLQQFCGVLGHTFMEFLKGSGDYCQAQHAAYADEWTAEQLAIHPTHLSHRRDPEHWQDLDSSENQQRVVGLDGVIPPAAHCPRSAFAWPGSRWNQPYSSLCFLLFFPLTLNKEFFSFVFFSECCFLQSSIPKTFLPKSLKTPEGPEGFFLTNIIGLFFFLILLSSAQRLHLLP